MLTEQIFEELTRKSPLRQNLITAAWPDLNVESKLQIMQYLNSEMSSQPDWLRNIASNDASAIVKFWSLKDADLKKPDSGKAKESEVDFYNNAIESIDPLINSLAAIADWHGFDHMNNASQLCRLLHIRYGRSESLNSFMSWVEQAIDNGVTDEELGECCQEYLNLKSVNEELCTVHFEDGWDAHNAGKGIETAWNVMKKAGPRLLSALLYRIPTNLGLKTISVETLCEMPERVISAFPYWNIPSKEIDQVTELMAKFPERLSERSIKSLNTFYKYGYQSSEEVQLNELYANPKPLKVLLEKVYELNKKTSELNMKIIALEKKRGLFF